MTCSGSTQPLAPAATAMRLAPSASVTISAAPVGASSRTATASTSTPSARNVAIAPSPSASSPTAETSTTVAPARAAAAAAFAPLPPGLIASAPPRAVSPGRGSRGTWIVRSTLVDPTTKTRPGARDMPGRLTTDAPGACAP